MLACTSVFHFGAHWNQLRSFQNTDTLRQFECVWCGAEHQNFRTSSWFYYAAKFEGHYPGSSYRFFCVFCSNWRNRNVLFAKKRRLQKAWKWGLHISEVQRAYEVAHVPCAEAEVLRGCVRWKTWLCPRAPEAASLHSSAVHDFPHTQVCQWMRLPPQLATWSMTTTNAWSRQWPKYLIHKQAIWSGTEAWL